MSALYCCNKDTFVATPVCLHFSADHHGDLQRMWCRMGTVTKSALLCCFCVVFVSAKAFASDVFIDQERRLGE